jgi:hypothetical protein
MVSIDKKELRALEFSAWSGRTVALKTALARIVSVEDADKQSISGLAMLAAKNGYAECLGLLLGAGAKPGRVDEMGMNESMWAASRGDAKVLSMLHRAGADIEALDNRGRSLMWHAESYARACPDQPESGACAALVGAERERRALDSGVERGRTGSAAKRM